MSIKIVQTNTLYLAGSGVIIGATNIVLTSFSDIYGNVLTMADFGSKGYITLEPNSSNEESATFTSVTANANSTFTLGGVSSVLAKSPYTESSGLTRGHGGGTELVVTDNAAFWNTFANKTNDETITGSWTFNTAPTSLSATPASTSALGNVKLTTTPSTSLGNPTITIATPAVVTLVAHGLFAGDSIRFTTTGALPTGLAIATTYYVSATSISTDTFQLSLTVGGAVINTSGTQSGTHTLLRTTPFAIGNEDARLPTQGENDALVGTTGIPSSTNRYVTEQGISFNMPTIQTFTTSGTWTKPVGLKYIVVEVQAAGGGGCTSTAYSSNQSGYFGSGGGGGGYSKKIISSSVLGASESVVTGTGGLGNVFPGATGGTSSFGAYLSATGGIGGAYDGSGGNGGTASGGYLNISGGGGGCKLNVGSSFSNGAGGGSFLGASGKQSSIGTSTSGIGGSLYGGGGNGGENQGSGGQGGNGIVIVTEFY